MKYFFFNHQTGTLKEKDKDYTKSCLLEREWEELEKKNRFDIGSGTWMKVESITLKEE